MSSSKNSYATVNSEEIKLFIDLLTSKAPQDAVLALSSKSAASWQHFFFRVRDAEVAKRKAIEEATLGKDLFCRTTLLREVPQQGRGLAEQTLGSSVLWVDIDPKDDLPLDILVSRVEKFVPSPSAIVCSGNGVHAYWCLTHFSETLEEMKMRLKGLEKALSADSCSDLARVLRVPGTLNWKVLPPKRCYFLLKPQFQTRHSLDAFPRQESTQVETPQGEITAESLPDAFLQALPRSLKNLIVEGDFRDRSKADWRVCVELLKRKYTPGQLLTVMCNTQWGISAKTREKGVSYAILTIRGAQEYLEKETFLDQESHVKMVDVLEATTDVANAKRLATITTEPLRYCSGLGFLSYKNGVYVSAGTAAIGAALKLPDVIREEALAQKDPSTQQTLLKWSLASRAYARLHSALELVKPLVEVYPGMLDRNPEYLNAKNGIIDLPTGTLLPHTPEIVLTKQTRVDFLPNARCPKWVKFLNEVFVRPAMVNFVQRLLGYAIGGGTGEQTFFIFYGRGANGKSTLLEVVHQILGEYCQSVNTEAFLGEDNNSESMHELARLVGCRLVVGTESNRGVLNEAMVKRITGSDTITARKLYQEAFEYRPQFKFILVTNHKPLTRYADDAFWRRVCLVPFTVSFSVEQQNQNLLPELLEEKDGILRWLVQGHKLWRKFGLDRTEVEEETKAYRQQVDVIGQFLEEQCEVQDPKARTNGKDLYASYGFWCAETGERVLSRRLFDIALVERGFRKVSYGGSPQWCGIKLR